MVKQALLNQPSHGSPGHTHNRPVVAHGSHEKGCPEEQPCSSREKTPHHDGDASLPSIKWTASERARSSHAEKVQHRKDQWGSDEEQSKEKSHASPSVWVGR